MNCDCAILNKNSFVKLLEDFPLPYLEVELQDWLENQDWCAVEKYPGQRWLLSG